MPTTAYRVEVKAYATRRPSFAWVLYYAGDRRPMAASQQIFHTEAAARMGGEARLKEYLRLIGLA